MPTYNNTPIHFMFVSQYVLIMRPNKNILVEMKKNVAFVVMCLN